MKYRRLTIEELKDLEKQFHLFLAAHSIPAMDWQKMKSNEPQKAEKFIDEFSDFIIENVLEKVEFLEYRNKNQIQIVDVRSDRMKMKGIKIVGNQKINLQEDRPPLELKAELIKHGGKVQMISADKKFSNDPNKDKFGLMQKGFLITKDPTLYQTLSSLQEEE